MVLAATQIVAIQRGVLVVSSAGYMPQVQDAAGPDSGWTRMHRLLVEHDAASTGALSGHGRGVAALRLYQETVALAQSSVGPAHRAVVEHTVDVIEAALLQLDQA